MMIERFSRLMGWSIGRYWDSLQNFIMAEEETTWLFTEKDHSGNFCVKGEIKMLKIFFFFFLNEKNRSNKGQTRHRLQF